MIPIFRSSKAVAILGVGNKPRDYNQDDIQRLSYLADIIWELTVKKQTEEALRQGEERLRSITDSAQDAIIMMDPLGKITFWNPAAERILGYSVVEALGQDLHQFITPERFRAAHAAAFPEFLRTGKGGAVGKTLELAAIRKDGVEIPISISLSSVKRDDGWHAVGIISDISERVKAREELLKLTRAIEQSPATVVITNLKGEIEYANPKFTRLTGYSLEEVLGQNPRVLKSGDMPPEGYKALWEAISQGKEWRGEFHNKKKNGDLYWEMATISPVTDSKGHISHYLAVKEDITELKRVEEEVAQMRLQLVQSDKLSTLGEMATGMAHEINQPLGAIALVVTAFKKYMEKKVLTEDKLTQGIKDIEESIKRMTSTINHIRVYARQESLEFYPINVPQTIDSALILLGEQLRIHGVECEKVLGSDLPQVNGEPHQLEQVWINLISNARDSMDEKEKEVQEGRLNIAGYRKTLKISVSHQKETKMLLLSFSDNGMGIDQEQAKKIFDPFFTTKGVGKGTGLGLSISFGIIDKHKGRIEVEGAKGEGVTFKVYLPAINV
ncbi:MAG: PAS domain S-box protein [Candidatus Omnitrophica bacterium]|nr:PAS domain S-box protein [Candidatus Omnitrophota bacterium]